jgi:hypothetical protein
VPGENPRYPPQVRTFKIPREPVRNDDRGSPPPSGRTGAVERPADRLRVVLAPVAPGPLAARVFAVRAAPLAGRARRHGGIGGRYRAGLVKCVDRHPVGRAEKGAAHGAGRCPVTARGGHPYRGAVYSICPTCSHVSYCADTRGSGQRRPRVLLRFPEPQRYPQRDRGGTDVMGERSTMHDIETTKASGVR